MGFKPCVDFFRKGNRFLLTQTGQRKLKQIKITGVKIAYFFKLRVNLPDEEEPSVEGQSENNSLESSEYQIWAKVFNFPYMPKRNPKKQDRYRKIEERIKEYIELNLRKKWINYPIDKYDIFETNELLGGVPDGEEIDISGKTVSILEIKTVTDIRNQRKPYRFYYPPINYQLQIALYMFLKGIDTGYIGICFLHPENWENENSLNLKSSLKKYSNQEQTFTGYIESWINSIGHCSYEYTILDSYCNDFTEDNELLLFKIKVNMEMYKVLLDKICNWFVNNKKNSPEIRQDELRKLLMKNKNW